MNAGALQRTVHSCPIIGPKPRRVRQYEFV